MWMSRPALATRLSACLGLLCVVLTPLTYLKAEAQEPKTRAQLRQDAPPPTFTDICYGEHPRQVLDFFKAETEEPAPLVVFIHGGGWLNGDKNLLNSLDVKRLIENGISVAAINYRFVSHAQDAGIEPPVKWPLEDAARAIQFLRTKAEEWNFDPNRIGANGSSAGACTSLWLALHDDLADPDSSDPVARESTRLTCAAVVGAQTDLDPHRTREWISNMVYGGHAFGFRKEGQNRAQEFQAFYEGRDDVLPWIKEYSPYEHVSADDPPIFLDYPAQDKPARIGEEQKDPTHSGVLGLMLWEKLKEHDVQAHLSYPGHRDPEFANSTDFLIKTLKEGG